MERLARPARAVAAVLIGLSACELGLRAAGWAYLRAGGRSGEVRAAGGDGLTLLCVGDSNTFGMYEAARDAWPARLQALLDARAAGAPHAVANLGMPGMTTAHVAALLERRLAEVRPDAVLVLAGVNNAWGWRGDSEVELAAPAAERLPWYEGLRLVKTFRLLRHRLAEPAPERPRPGDFEAVPLAGGAAAGPVDGGARVAGVARGGEAIAFDALALAENLAPDALARSVTHDLERIHAVVSSRGARLVLLTYAGDREGYAAANAGVRAAARALDATLVECAGPTAAAVERHGYDALLYPDQHPKGAGYELVARLAYNALVDTGLARGEPVAAPLADLPVGGRPPPPLQLVVPAGAGRDVTDARLEIAGEEPGRAFRVVLSDAGDGPPASLRGLRLPVRGDALFRGTVDLPALHGAFDERGRASLPVGAILGRERLERLAAEPLLTAYLTYVDPDRRRVRWFSDAAELRSVAPAPDAPAR